MAAASFNCWFKVQLTAIWSPEAPFELRLWSGDNPTEIRAVEFQRPAAAGLFQVADLDLSPVGWWEGELKALGPGAGQNSSAGSGPEAVAGPFAVYVSGSAARWQAFWPWFAWPVLAIGLFAIHECLVVRATRPANR